MIRKIESEERRPSTQIAERLAEILKIPQHEHTRFLRFERGEFRSVLGGVGLYKVPGGAMEGPHPAGIR